MEDEHIFIDLSHEELNDLINEFIFNNSIQFIVWNIQFNSFLIIQFNLLFEIFNSIYCLKYSIQFIVWNIQFNFNNSIQF